VVPYDTSQDSQLTPIDGGFRLKLSDDGRHHIDILKMLFNWRLVTTPVGHEEGWDRGWCYFGHGEETTMRHALFRAAAAAYVWDGSDDTEPQGYDKRVGG